MGRNCRAEAGLYNVRKMNWRRGMWRGVGKCRGDRRTEALTTIQVKGVDGLLVSGGEAVETVCKG